MICLPGDKDVWHLYMYTIKLLIFFIVWESFFFYFLCVFLDALHAQETQFIYDRKNQSQSVKAIVCFPTGLSHFS